MGADIAMFKCDSFREGGLVALQSVSYRHKGKSEQLLAPLGAKTPRQHRFLRMQAVFRLVEHD